MAWGSTARERADALDAKIEGVTGRMEEVVARVDRLAADLDRLSSWLDELRHRVDADGTDRRRQADQLSAARRAIGEWQDQGRETADRVAELREESRTIRDTVAELREQGRETTDSAAGQASRLDAMEDRSGQQGRSLDQVRADVTRIDRQSAADLAELRATDAALARAVLRANAGPRPDAPGRPDATPASSGRAHEAADELATPEAAPLAIVEEEPAERQAAQ